MRKLLFILLLFPLIGFGQIQNHGQYYKQSDESSQTVVVLSTPTTGFGLWLCPEGVTTIIVECWGKGGGGGTASGLPASGGGGGGGAYILKTLSVTPGINYGYLLGSASNGPDTHFSTSETAMAKGGSTGGNAFSSNQNGAGGAGGLASSSIGDIKYNGGTGGTGNYTSNGGGGGGGAGSSGIGGNGSGSTGGTGTSDYGGNGGSGRTGSSGVGSSGAVYGGGGGGGWTTVSTNYGGGQGQPGLIRITY